MSTWKVSVYGDCLPLSHLSHHRRLDSPAPKYNQSWCPDEHVGSIVYGDYPPPDALLALSQHRWQPVPAPPPPQNIYHPTNHDVLQDWQRAQARGTIMLCASPPPSTTLIGNESSAIISANNWEIFSARTGVQSLRCMKSANFDWLAPVPEVLGLAVEVGCFRRMWLFIEPVEPPPNDSSMPHTCRRHFTYLPPLILSKNDQTWLPVRGILIPIRYEWF